MGAVAVFAGEGRVDILNWRNVAVSLHNRGT